MQLVINIAEKDYKRIKDIPDVFDSLISRVYTAIRNGTPLPDEEGEEDTEQPDRDEQEAFKMAHSKCERCGSMDRRVYTRTTLAYESQYKIRCPHCLLENEVDWFDEQKDAWEAWDYAQEKTRIKKEKAEAEWNKALEEEAKKKGKEYIGSVNLYVDDSLALLGSPNAGKSLEHINQRTKRYSKEVCDANTAD